MSYVTIDTFDAENLTQGELNYYSKPIVHQKIPILYKYRNGPGPLKIITPILPSIGVMELKDLKKENEVTGYSMGFHGYQEIEGPCESQEKFIHIVKQIEEFCNKVLRENEAEIVKKKKKNLGHEPMRILRYSVDKPNAPPIIFTKIFTDEHKNIKVNFFRKKTKKDVKNVVNGNKVLVPALNYVKQRCLAVACLKIESIFIGNIGEFIQIRLAEALIVKKLDSVRSVLGADLDLGPEESGSDSEGDDESKEEVPLEKSKREIVVRQKRSAKEMEDFENQNDEDEDEDEIEDEDEVMEALKSAVKRQKQ